MAKLAYYASRIAPDKPHQLETPEGYRIYTAVPICRSGYQEYLGKELKSHPDYDPSWNIADDEVVKVYRPREVVTAPETIASFEGKSVLDGHPPEDVAIVQVENEDQYGKGHAQNMRVGPELEDGEAKGEVSILGDLFVKDQPLNDKIDGGVRDVSCGYLYNLKRADDGTLVMTRICGNHVAVVPKGRAGPEVSIRDAATVTSDVRPKPEIRKEKSIMKDSFWGRIIKLVAKDAEPEDLEKLAKHAKDSESEEEKEGKEAKDKAAKDKGKSAKDAEERTTSERTEEREEKEGGEVELHPELKQHITDTKGALDAIMEHLGVGKAKKEGEEATGDANVLEMTTGEQGKTELPKQIAADAAFLKAIKPLVVASKDKDLIAGFNDQVRKVKAAGAAHDASPYAGLAHAASPLKESVEVIDPAQFFNGVPYAEGLRRYNEAQEKAKKGGK